MMKKHDYSIEEQKKAAYALNMCTVSVSQILDYNDVYVLEQEYDAILNNLNLEEIPKDEKETLLNILQEILNVISFFRIQKTRRDQNEKKYQQRMKNAIWHAIPSFNMMVALSGSLSAKNTASSGARVAKSVLGTGPAMAAWSIATQIGTAYMSYRREKAVAAQEKEDSEIELEIAAVEQLHALQRELFTTAWRMADEYGYPDRWRLTEKQIEHYNQVLMDSNEIRKYARLEAMQKNFEAYPAFWYNFAHTALYIATTFEDEAIKKSYLEKAEEHFQKYREINAFNLLREDQITASANLEYADLLLQKPNPDLEKINNLIAGAEEKAGGALDILQLCAIAYLRTGETPAAERLFKILVNEDYNAVTNAQLLSRLYVKTYITGDMIPKKEALRDYQFLERQVGGDHLFPMPSQVKCPGEKSPEEQFLATQKALLEKMYRLSINAYEEQQARMFCAVLPAPEPGERKEESYYGPGVKAQQQRLRDAELALTGRSAADYMDRLSESNFRYRYIDVLNCTIAGMEELACFRNLAKHDEWVNLPAQSLEKARDGLQELQKKMDDGSFTYKDYRNLAKDYSYQYFMAEFFARVKEDVMNAIEAEQQLDQIEDFRFDLEKFCENHRLPSPDEYIQLYKESGRETAKHDKTFFEYSLLFDQEKNIGNISELKKAMLEIVQKNFPTNINMGKIHLYTYESREFLSYLKNKHLIMSDTSAYELRQQAVAILYDETRKNDALILAVDGVRFVQGNCVGVCRDYSEINGNQNPLNWVASKINEICGSFKKN